MNFSVAFVFALLAVFVGASSATAAKQAWFDQVEQEQAWRLLPPLETGEAGPLPNWALALARPLPRTTAAMLELDDVQRTQNTLDPKLRAKIRWVAARANGCRYTEAYAASDLVRAGGDVSELKAIDQDPSSLPAAERAAYRFARRLCQESYAVTDEQVEELLNAYGRKDLAGIVLLLAYSNFQDRLMIGLGIEVEEDGPLPPIRVRFDWNAASSVQAPPRDRSTRSGAQSVPEQVADAEWAGLGFEQLVGRLEEQKNRASRIPVMEPTEVEKYVWPQLYSPSAATEIVWHNVTWGYQAPLVNHWFFALRKFREESENLGPFRQSVFWVVTRATQCNYCMGHTMMLMEVAGMNLGEIRDHCQVLSSGDWSSFTPDQRAMLHFARRLTSNPLHVSRDDVELLRDQLGELGAVDALWHISWCNFMVRVSNAFQMPLEKRNVFWRLHGKTPPAEEAGASR